jgi:NAD(P)-dependent dehydrogenase (short-subunit alcohol dehydrogenase family)
MKILITGATGFIGSAVARALLARDHEVLGLARSTRSAAALQQAGIAPVSGDFGDPASVARAVTSSGPDAVVSTASVGSLGVDYGQRTERLGRPRRETINCATRVPPIHTASAIPMWMTLRLWWPSIGPIAAGTSRHRNLCGSPSMGSAT